MNDYVTDYHDINGTDFEITNCPAYETGDCIATNYKIMCQNHDKCIIKSHVIHLVALLDVASRRPGSAEQIGTLCCLNTFLIKKKEERNDNNTLK